jgi:hypothetical protein
MASLIRIKRSATAGAPSTLKLGELAYSHLANNGANGGDILYIGAGTVDGNGDAPVIAIGGNYYVTQINNATDLNTASRIVRRDSSGNFSAGTITAALSGNASTATALATGRTISITGDLSYTSASFDGSGNVTGTGTLATLLSGSGGVNQPGVSYGSNTTVPVITVDAKGRITAITTNSIALGSSNLSIAGGTGTDTVVVGTDTLTFAGGTGVATTVTNNQVSIAIGQAVSTTSNVTFNDLTVSGNLTVSGTTTTVNSTTVDVADINITVAKNATTAAQANGAGLTVNGPTTAATFTYTSADDRWNLNKNLNVTTVFGALSGNASTATALATGRTISITGDLTYTSGAFDGTGNVTGTGTLANTTVTANSYGSSTSVATFTVDSKGRLTAAGSSAIPTATSSVLGLASFNSSDFLVTAGAVTIATVDGGTY